MSLRFLIDDEYIPNDGSKGIISQFEKNTNADILVFPDVHMKKGALIANGMLISSEYNIYLSCLGVENCGFTFGKIENLTETELMNSFSKFSKILRDRTLLPKYSSEEVLNLFDRYLEREFIKKKDLYALLGYSNLDNLIADAHLILDTHILKLAAKKLCTLGGGNHFFEAHKITDVYDSDILKVGDYVYMLHSDSISVGDTIYELYSDLHEMKGTGSLRDKYRVWKFKTYQKHYFRKLCKRVKGLDTDLKKLFYPRNEYQAIDIRTPLGRNLMLAHNLSSVFGEMNRDAIIQAWETSQGISTVKICSHSHDNVSIEEHDGSIRVVHRNGVQNLGNDKYCILPSAMGNYSYVMKNAYNSSAYYSANHGTGRMEDKHIARKHYTEDATMNEMEERKVSLFRVGNGNLAEQNMHAFKEPAGIIAEMEKYNLAYKSARTYPIAVIKG